MDLNSGEKVCLERGSGEKSAPIRIVVETIDVYEINYYGCMKKRFFFLLRF